VAVEPGVGRHVAVVDEDRLGVPVLDLPGQPVTPLQDQHALAGRREPVGEGAATGTGSHDDHVVVV
jgi:hypothetical protein